MGSDWRESTVGDFCPFFYGKALPEPQREPGRVSVFGSAGKIGSHSKSIAERGVVIGRKGTVGAVHLSDSPFWAIDTAFYVKDQPERRDLNFTYALLRSIGLEKMNSDSAVPGLNRENAHAIPVTVPPLAVQRHIGNCISLFNARIDHNRALAANLEAIARALFKSWFVDFDPVRAKAAGEAPPGLAPDLAALFPYRFVDSELGEIPEGWRVASLSSFADLDTTSMKPFDEPGVQWTHFSIPAFDEGRFPVFESGDQIASNKYLVRPGSVLVSKLNPTQWRCWRPPSELVSPRSVCSTEFMQFVPPVGQSEFLWGLCESSPLRDLVLTTVDGTTGSRQRAKPRDVARGSLVFPNEPLASEYSNAVRPLLQRADASTLEAKALAQLRDLLLPRLISGKLCVEDAEAALEAA